MYFKMLIKFNHTNSIHNYYIISNLLNVKFKLKIIL